MATRKRIGYGLFDLDGQRNSKVWLQNEFLKTIEDQEPKQKKKPLGDLAAQPFEEYVSYREKQDPQSVLRRQQVSKRAESASGRSSLNLLDADDPLRESIFAWGETYHLNSDWCYEVVLLTLQHWHRFDGETGKRFESLPSYGHQNYLGFGSLVMVYNLANMPSDSLSEVQKALVRDFSEGDEQFVAFFNERERAFLSSYPHDPHIMDDEHFLNRIEGLIEMAVSNGGEVLPVLHLLNKSDRDSLRLTLFKRAKELLKRINEYTKSNSVKPKELGSDTISEHLKWAVRHQVFDERFYSIESNAHSSQYEKRRAYAKVRKDVLNILSFIDLQPRKPLRGRSRLL
jgi:hypothetical protein